MSAKRPFWKPWAVEYAAAAVMLFLGLYGSIFCLLSAFQVRADEEKLLLACLLAALLCPAAYGLKRRLRRLPVGLAALAVLGIVAWLRLDQVVTGALLCASQAVDAVSESLGVDMMLDITPWLGNVTPGAARSIRDVTAMGEIVVWLFGFWLGWLHTRLRTFSLTFWGSAPVLLLPLAVGITPDWAPLAALLTFWTVGLLTRRTARSDRLGTARLSLPLVPVTLAALMLLHAVLPSEDYHQAEWAEQRRLQLSDWVMSTLREQKMPSSQPVMGIRGNSTEIDLTGAGPLHFTGETVLTVSAGKSGHIYLRGMSSAVYTGDGWEQLSASDSAALAQVLALGRSPTAAGYVDYQPINFPGLATSLTRPSRVSTAYTIENVGALGRVMYTPYQLLTTPSRLSGGEFVDDAYVARGAGVWKYVFYAQDDSDPESDTVTAQSGSSGQLAQAEEAYREFVYEHYLQVPEELEEALAAASESIWNSYGDKVIYSMRVGEVPQPSVVSGTASRLKLAEAAAEYLGAQTSYDPETPVTPAGEDFVDYFLNVSHRGYCMHYASTAVLLLRTLGVPARYVSGYTADVQVGMLTQVPDSAAHAWVEVYCDGYGWQPVEVTPGYTSGRRPGTSQSQLTPLPSETPAVGSPSPRPSTTPAPRPSQSANVEQPAKEQEKSSGGGVNGWLVAAAAAAALLALALLRRKAGQWSRKRRFAQADANAAVIGMYGYMAALSAFGGGEIDPRAEELAKKARFSQHTLSAEEREYVAECAAALARATDEGARWYRRLALRYVRGLY